MCNVREEERKKERQKGEGGVKYDGNPEREKKRESERERQGGRENEREREEERGTEIGGGEESWKEKNRKEVEKKKKNRERVRENEHKTHLTLFCGFTNMAAAKEEKEWHVGVHKATQTHTVAQ